MKLLFFFEQGRMSQVDSPNKAACLRHLKKLKDCRLFEVNIDPLRINEIGIPVIEFLESYSYGRGDTR